MSFSSLAISGVAGAVIGSVAQDYIGEHGDLDTFQEKLNYLSQNAEILCYTTALALFAAKYAGHKGFDAAVSAMKVAFPVIMAKVFLRHNSTTQSILSRAVIDVSFDAVTILNSAILAGESRNLPHALSTSSAFVSAGILSNLSRNFVSLKTKGAFIACAIYTHRYFNQGN